MSKDEIRECESCTEHFCMSCAYHGRCENCGNYLCDECYDDDGGICAECKEIAQKKEEEVSSEERAKQNNLDEKNGTCQTCDYKHKRVDSFPCTVCSTGPKNGVIDHYRQEVRQS